MKIVYPVIQVMHVLSVRQDISQTKTNALRVAKFGPMKIILKQILALFVLHAVLMDVSPVMETSIIFLMASAKIVRVLVSALPAVVNHAVLVTQVITYQTVSVNLVQMQSQVVERVILKILAQVAQVNT